MRGFLRSLAFATIALLSTHVAAQTFPEKPVRIVVPFPAGGAGDTHVRMLGSKLAPILGQQIVVDNRAGASGTIGADHVAKSPPDGYTLLFATTNWALGQAITPNLPFNVVTDFAPVSMTLTAQNLLVVRKTLAVTDVKGLIALAKANPGKLSFGSSGVGTPWLGMELMKSLAGLDIVHVPYKGDTPAMTDLLGGHIDMLATNISALAPYHRTGEMRGLAVTSAKRSPSLPEVPTMAEAGIPGYELESWFGIVAPAGVPRPIIDRLNAALAQVIAMPDVQKTMTDLGLEPRSSTPDEYAARIVKDIEKFKDIVKTAGIKPD